MLKRSMVLMAVMALLMVFAVPASAGAPVIFEDEVYEWEDELNPWLTEACGFEVYETGHEAVIVKGYFDGDGNLIRVEVHVKGTVMTYKEDGPTLFDRFAFHITDDLVNETTTVRGNNWNVHLPGSGSGVVVNMSGLLIDKWGVGEIKLVGPKLEDGWIQDFCDALDS